MPTVQCSTTRTHTHRSLSITITSSQWRRRRRAICESRAAPTAGLPPHKTERLDPNERSTAASHRRRRSVEPGRSMDSSVLTRLVYRAPWPIGRRQSVVRPATEFDGCNISNSNVVGDKLQPVSNAVARVVTGTRKFDRGLGRILHDQLNWLYVPDRVVFKLAITVHQCLNGRAPPYLSEHCIPVSSASAFRQPSPTCRAAFPAQHLRPSGVLRCRHDGLELTPGFIRDPTSSTDCFRCLLETYLFARY